MTKKKNIAGILFMALLVLTLISFCFLGQTFARYTSSESGTGALQVAKWSITFVSETDEDSTKISFSKLSPSKNAYSEGTARSNSSAPVLVATITNNSDVEALVTISGKDSLTVEYYSNETHDDAGYGDEGVTRLFSVALYTGDRGDIKDLDNLTKLSGEIKLEKDASVYVYAVATWTTDNTNSSNDNGAAADALDTFVGMYVDSISFTLTYTAVQNSMLSE